MSKDKKNKTQLMGSIFLFFCFITTPSINGSNSFDDITPPITTISIDPPEPNGLNGWYISNVNVTLNATDDLSGVKTIYYRLPGEEWNNHSGDSIILLLDYDCLKGEIEYYSVDNAGNNETINSYKIYIDQKEPIIEITYEVGDGNPLDGWELIFTTQAVDECSGMDKAEFYLNDVLQETVIGPGPTYVWSFRYFQNSSPFSVMGVIFNPKITDDYVNFFAIFVMISGSPSDLDVYTIAYDKAGNYAKDQIMHPTDIIPGIYMFKNLSFPNDYHGHISNFFIWAKFFLY